MIRQLVTVVMAIFTTSVIAAPVTISSARVDRLLTDGANYGHCMAALTPTPTSVDARCKGIWVSFSCSGDYNTKSDGRAKFDAASLALVTGKRVVIRMETTKTHNDFCFAERIDVLR